MQPEVITVGPWQFGVVVVTLLLSPLLNYWLAKKGVKKEVQNAAAKVEATAAVLAHKTAISERVAERDRSELKELVKENNAMTQDSVTAATAAQREASRVKEWRESIQQEVHHLSSKVGGLEQKIDTLLVASAKWEMKR